MKNRKILVSLILILLLEILISTVNTYEDVYAATTLADIKTYNYDIKENLRSTDLMINGGTITFCKPASTYDFLDENGNFNSVYTSENNVYWSTFDNNMKLTKTVSWPLYYNWHNEENIMSGVTQLLTYNFGNAIYYNKNLYVMYSRMMSSKTQEERKKEKVMALAKYDKSGKQLAVKEYLGIELNSNTYYDTSGTSTPFYSANCSLAVNNGIIACFFGKNRLDSHQDSNVVFFDANTLEFVSNMRDSNLAKTNRYRYSSIYGHSISHSLGQRIIPTSDGQFLMMESGDAGASGSTRGLNLTKIYEEYNQEVDYNIWKESTKRVVHYSEGAQGPNGYNYTYSVLGNIIELSDGYMYIGGLDKTINRAYGTGVDTPWNIVAQKYKKNFYTMDSYQDMQLLSAPVRQTSGIPAVQDEYNSRRYLTGNEKDYGVKYLTDLKDNSVILVRAVKTEKENIVILWEQFEIEEEYENGKFSGYNEKKETRTTYYMIIDKNANIVVNPIQIPDISLNDEEQYVYKDGKIYWTTTNKVYNKLTVNVLNVNVEPVKSITLNKSNISLYVGKTEDLNVSFNPTNTTQKSITWSSNNNNVAKVENGKITAVGKGTATITATAQNGSKATCNVTVKKLPFDDVKSNDYFYDPVIYTYENKIIAGKSDTKFAPFDDITRGQLVTILYRMEGSPKIGNKNPFTDVKKSAGNFYYEGVIWASEKGIVSGYGNGKFGPNNTITRAQLATILWNYAQYKKIDVKKVADISKYPDYKKIKSETPYAVEALSWAVENKVMSGTADGNLSSTGTANRAQAAAMVTNYCTYVKK